MLHKKVKGRRKQIEDGGVMQQRHNETAEEAARIAARSGDETVHGG